MRYDENAMKPGLVKRSTSSSINGLANNPVCNGCPDASGSAYLMKFHYERLIRAAEHLGWFEMGKAIKGPVDLFNRIHKAVNEHKKKTGNKCPFKVRVCLRHNGRLEIGVEPIMSTKSPLLFPDTFDLNEKQTHPSASKKPIFKTVLDVLPTRNTTYTRDKTYYRTMYNYARHCAGIQSFQDAKEVLLYNKDDFVMDGSITTPYFYRGGKWVTPHNECGGQQGTTRRWALDHGLCNAGFIHRDSLRRGEIIWLSNGVKGFFTARVVISSDISRPPSFESTSGSEASRSSSRSSVFVDNNNTKLVTITHSDENREDDIEPSRRKHPPAEGADAFRTAAFDLDVFGKSIKDIKL